MLLGMQLKSTGTKPQQITMKHYDDVIMTTMASQITSLTVVYSTVYLDADQRKHQRSASLAFVWGIHRWIPRTKGQLRGKCFHLMTSSCVNCAHNLLVIHRVCILVRRKIVCNKVQYVYLIIIHLQWDSVKGRLCIGIMYKPYCFIHKWCVLLMLACVFIPSLCGMKLIIHSQTSTVAPLKFGNW